MSMSKKDFIALANVVRDFNRLHDEGSVTANHFDAQQIAALANFCQSQNPAFNRSRWLGYIVGLNGPSGGAVK